MEKKLIFIPKWETSTHDTFHLYITQKMDCTAIGYKDVVTKFSPTSVEKIASILYSILMFIKFQYVSDKRKALIFKKVNISHSLIEYYIRNTSFGLINTFSYKTFKLINEAVTYIFVTTHLFKSNRIQLVIGGDEAYLHGSILGQLANEYKVQTIFFKQYQKLVAGFSFSSKTLYAGPDFAFSPKISFSSYQQLVDLAGTELDKSLSGEAKYFYMKKNQQNLTSESDIEKIKGSIFLYLHDFIDSPGLFGDSIFLDQWKWLKTVSEVAVIRKQKVHIKIHPGISPLNNDAIKKLYTIYRNHPYIQIWDTKIGVQQLKENGCKGILTLFGTVMLEATLVGLPCFCASNHPYMYFGVCLKANSINEYKKYLCLMIDGKLESNPNKLSKMQIAQSFASFRIQYYINQITVNMPYDDIEKSLFKEIYPDVLESDNFGNFERRSVILNSNKMREYVTQFLSVNGELIISKIKERMN